MKLKQREIYLGLVMIAHFSAHSMQNMPTELPIIPDASYFIMKDDHQALFYTATGELIKCQYLQGLSPFLTARNKIDKGAPKPQPQFYKIEWDHCEQIWQIRFYDPNGNCICKNTYFPETHDINYYDIDHLYDEIWDFLSTTLEKMNEDIPYLDLSKVYDATESSDSNQK